jgi:hypothetical protein
MKHRARIIERNDDARSFPLPNLRTQGHEQSFDVIPRDFRNGGLLENPTQCLDVFFIQSANPSRKSHRNCYSLIVPLFSCKVESLAPLLRGFHMTIFVAMAGKPGVTDEDNEDDEHQ